MGDLSGIDPPRMNWSAGDLPSAFSNFKQYCELIFDGPLVDKDEARRVTYVLLWVGQEGLRMYNTWELSDVNKGKLSVLWEGFTRMIEPKTNFRLNRFHLQRYKQAEGESVDEYMTRCKLQAKKCRFRDACETNDRLIEQLIVGIKHPKVQEKLLGRDADLTLDGAMDIARTCEATMSDMQLFKEESSIHYVRKQRHLARQQHQQHADNRQIAGCKYCGGRHSTGRDNCPAYGSKCLQCGRLNHWKAVCTARDTVRSRTGSRTSQSRGRDTSNRSMSRRRTTSRGEHPTTIHNVDSAQQLSEPFETMVIDVMHLGGDTRSEVFASLDIKLGKRPAILKVKVDTGAQENVLPLRMYRRMYPNNLDVEGYPMTKSLQPSLTVLTAYNGESIRQYGRMKLRCAHQDTNCVAEFFVADTPGPAILGLPSCRDLQLVTMNCEVTHRPPNDVIQSKNDLLREYPDVFEGIGRFDGAFHITTDPSITPVVHAPRKCPIHLRDEIQAELQDMENIGVIAKVTAPTEWVSSIVCSRKSSGRLRICLDPKDLNEAIRRPHYKTPTLDEITHKLAGAKIFSKLDARHGYWAVVLDDESSLKTTFNSPFGRFRFRRLPFGLNLSQDVYQERMDHILEHCPGTMSIADDVAVFGRDEDEHDANLRNLMETARRHGLVFNNNKCDIKCQSIHFFGLVFDAAGTHPDPKRVDDIRQMKRPTNPKELQEFLGVVTYTSPFIPNLSRITAPLRDLLKRDAEFEWTASHDIAFEETKAQICREVTLAYFEPNAESTVQVDASSRGLGAVLLQNGKPIAFASKSLSGCEQRYANIEREMLAVVFGCERFHTFVYGKHFTVESDHKPLEMIHLKNLAAAPQRLQRMLLRVQQYDFKLRYKPGKDMALADTMSRQPCTDDDQIDLDVQITFVILVK